MAETPLYTPDTNPEIRHDGTLFAGDDQIDLHEADPRLTSVEVARAVVKRSYHTAEAKPTDAELQLATIGSVSQYLSAMRSAVVAERNAA